MKLELNFKENNQTLDMNFGQFQELSGGSDIDIITEIDLDGEYDGNDVPSMGALIGILTMIGENFASNEDLALARAECDSNFKKANDNLQKHIENQGYINATINHNLDVLSRKVTALEEQSVVIDEISDLVGGAE